MSNFMDNNAKKLKSAEEKLEDLKKDLQELGFDLKETDEGIELLERDEK